MTLPETDELILFNKTVLSIEGINHGHEFKRIEISSSKQLATIKSNLVLSLKAPAVVDIGKLPTVYIMRFTNVPSPLPNSMVILFS